MAGAYVFPGGIIDPADSNLKWCELFSTFGYGNSNFTSLIPKATVRPKIFRSLQDELPREISLRITAIRETFEECGVLVCRQKDNRTSSTWAQYVSRKKLCIYRSVQLRRVANRIICSSQRRVTNMAEQSPQ